MIDDEEDEEDEDFEDDEVEPLDAMTLSKAHKEEMIIREIEASGN